MIKIMHIKSTLIPVMMIIFLLPLFAKAGDKANIPENEKTKSDFLYNFTKYIQWPTEKDSGDFVISVFGDSPVLEALRQMAQKKTVNGRKIKIQQIFNSQDITNCDILFVPEKRLMMIPVILNKAKDKQILTVGESDLFAKNGGMINFIIIDGKLKFEINLNVMKNAGFTIGSQLLKLAILVNGDQR